MQKFLNKSKSLALAAVSTGAVLVAGPAWATASPDPDVQLSVDNATSIAAAFNTMATSYKTGALTLLTVAAAVLAWRFLSKLASKAT